MPGRALIGEPGESEHGIHTHTHTAGGSERKGKGDGESLITWEYFCSPNHLLKLITADFTETGV